MVQHHLDDDPNPPLVGIGQKLLEVIERPVIRVNRAIVGNVVAVVREGRGKKWHHPKGIDSQLLQIVDFLREPLEIADTISVAVEEGTDVDLINDCVLVPESVVLSCQETSLHALAGVPQSGRSTLPANEHYITDHFGSKACKPTDFLPCAQVGQR